jgi:hypothetical protein
MSAFFAGVTTLLAKIVMTSGIEVQGYLELGSD